VQTDIPLDATFIAGLSRFILRRHLAGPDGSWMFSRACISAAVADAAAPWNRSTIVLLSPQDFLLVAAPIYHADDVDPGRDVNRFERSKLSSIAEALADAGLDEMPHLTLEPDGTAHDLRVVGHEGRHRALAAMRRNVARLPVTLRFRGSPGRADDGIWALMNEPPSRLLGEGGNRDNGIALRTLPITAAALGIDANWAEAMGAALDAMHAVMFLRPRASSHGAGDAAEAWANLRRFETLAAMSGEEHMNRARRFAERAKSAVHLCS
jgi:hypothetical protein